MGFKRTFKFALVGVLVSLFVHWIINWTNGVDINEFYKNKRIIITGTSRGIGKDLAIQLAQTGARLLITARNAELLESTVAACKQVTPEVYYILADLGKEEDCKNLADFAISKMGGVDILILNAAYAPKPVLFKETANPDQIFKRVFSVNVLQSVNLVNHLLPALNETSGHIVAVSSAASFLGIPKVLPYSTSKHALNGFFKGLKQEFILSNVPVAITIIPLPFVLTERAKVNWKPVEGIGMTSEECARRMIYSIPSRNTWIFVEWSSYIIGHIHSFSPELIDYVARFYISMTTYQQF